MGKRNEAPLLDCPSCGVPLIKAHARGRLDRDGHFIMHRYECRCRWCEWVWWDTAPAVVCGCKSLVRVVVDDDRAVASEVRAPVRGLWDITCG